MQVLSMSVDILFNLHLHSILNSPPIQYMVSTLYPITGHNTLGEVELVGFLLLKIPSFIP